MTDFAEIFDPRPIPGIDREPVEERFSQAVKFMAEHHSRPRPDRTPLDPRRRGRPKDDPRKQWRIYDFVWRVSIKFRLKPTRNDHSAPLSACDAIAQANRAAGRTPNSFHGIKAIFLKGRAQEAQRKKKVGRELRASLAKARNQINWQNRLLDSIVETSMDSLARKAFKPVFPGGALAAFNRLEQGEAYRALIGADQGLSRAFMEATHGRSQAAVSLLAQGPSFEVVQALLGRADSSRRGLNNPDEFLTHDDKSD